MIKLYLKYVEFLDATFKRLYEELKAIKAMLPKPKPRPPKPPKEVKKIETWFSRPMQPDKLDVARPSGSTTTMKVSVEKIKKNLDYIKDIRREVDHYNKTYVNDSIPPMTATKMFHQPISGTYRPSVLSASISIEDYMKMMYKKPGNVKRRANRILDEIDENIQPKPKRTPKPNDGRKVWG